MHVIVINQSDACLQGFWPNGLVSIFLYPYTVSFHFTFYVKGQFDLSFFTSFTSMNSFLTCSVLIANLRIVLHWWASPSSVGTYLEFCCVLLNPKHFSPPLPPDISCEVPLPKSTQEIWGSAVCSCWTNQMARSALNVGLQYWIFLANATAHSYYWRW